MRRSSRLRRKRRVDYSEQAQFEKGSGLTQKQWENITEKGGKARPQRGPLADPLFQPQQLFRKRIPKKQPPRRQRIVRYQSRIERDEQGVDFPELSESAAMNESAQNRMQRFAKQPQRSRTPALRREMTPNIPLSKKRKHLLFMNPGDDPIQAAILAISRRIPLPAWAQFFKTNLLLKNGILYWTEPDRKIIPFALKDTKRDAVKNLYFDPREPSTIIPITLHLYKKYANISRRNVTRVLKSLKTYQLNFGRRRPPDLKNRLFMYKPGMLAMDMFFPSSTLGWAKTNVLCCMDTWSRYCGVYAIDTKRQADVLKGMTDFLAKFASMGHLPRRILSDKGTDMAGAARAIEPYRQAKDGNAPMVLHTATGTPVLIVEGLNAQVQRRMQIFRTAGLIEEASQILHEITDQLNNEPRAARGFLTPIQLLALDEAGRTRINTLYRDKYIPEQELHGLPQINVNDTVRRLEMSRKEQETNAKKGFAPKWSEQLYTVLRKTKLRMNPYHYRYDIGLPDTFYRHELQKIIGLDEEVPNLVRYKEVAIGGYDPADDAEWDHDD